MSIFRKIPTNVFRIGKNVVQLEHRGTHSSNGSVNKSNSAKYHKFENYLTYRRTQAEKSILIQINGVTSCPEVRKHLSSTFGPLESIYHYSIPSKGKSGPPSTPIAATGGEFHWLLAEFEKKEDFLKAVSSCGNVEGTVPYTSSMTWHVLPGQLQAGQVGKKSRGRTTQASQELDGIKSEALTASANVNFGKGKNLNQQLTILEESLKLSDLGIRLRFLIAHQLETSFLSLFPQGCVLPFGSTVSGIGRQSGDLDLVLLPDKKEIFAPSQNDANKQTENQLMFQTKMYTSGNSSNARFQVQRVMETIADIIQLCVPGCTHIQRILQARVPILRFWSDYTDLQCDLSMTNSSGVHMSELIYIMTKLDPRFSTLLFAIRSWASARKITNPVPGRQPTNFMFVLLLMYFLQHKKILPTLDVLFNNPDTSDLRITADGIDCTFLRRTDRISKHFTPQCPTESVAELLFEFFEFYSEFDFHTKGVSLLTGSAWGKPDAGPLYIQNPLERHSNVARNVSKEEVSKFKSECCSALWKLETRSNSDKHPISLQDLLLTPVYIPKGPEQNRIKVKELFSE